MSEVKVMVKLNKETLRKFSKTGRKPQMNLGMNVIGINYSEAVFENQEIADKYLKSDERKYFMDVERDDKCEQIVEEKKEELPVGEMAKEEKKSKKKKKKKLF